jgi:putative ABC transport system permease protein
MKTSKDSAIKTSIDNTSQRIGSFFISFGNTWSLASRNILRQRSRSFLLGLLILFASFVIVYFSQFLEGVSKNFTKNLISLASGDIYVSSKVDRKADGNLFDRDYEYFHLSPQFFDNLAKLEGFSSVSHRIEFNARIVTDSDTIPQRIMSFDPMQDSALLNNFTFTTGQMFNPGEYGIILPEDVARRYGVTVGNRVRLLAKSVNKQINLIDFIVTGIFRTNNLSAWFDTYAYIDLKAARALLDDTGTLTRLNIHLDKGAQPKAFVADLDKLLKAQGMSNNPNLEATYWADGAGFFSELTMAMQLGYVIVIVIIITMIAASLALAAVMTVIERTKEIATLGAIGATPPQIRRILVGEQILLAGAAALLGTTLAGVLFIVTSYTGIPLNTQELRGFLGSSHFYPAFNFDGFLAGMLVPLLVAFLATYIFARRASKLSIAQAMADP